MNRDVRQLGPHLKPPSDVNPNPDAPLDFPDREFGELGESDYRELGFLGGLEVHQQLATRTKLFCRCPVGMYGTHTDAEVLRHMRPTLSELGEYDGTALMEFKTRKEIVYLLDRRSVCTYEMDDTPPFEIDEQAVRIALEVADLFDLNPVGELHVMRKQYLDGSIPTGFQRTAMIGLDGAIPFRVPELGVDRTLRIRQLSLEEDSCREVSDIGHRIVFRTDRLGMPLTEVVTEPEFYSPLELQAGARLVARTTRVVPSTRRGAGSARQDVNVSVAGGRRIEIKGVSHHRGLPRLVHNEAYRQLNLLRIRNELHRRGVTHDALLLPDGGFAWNVSPMAIDATSILRRSDFAPLRDTIDAGGIVVALRLPEFRGLFTHRTQSGAYFAHEFSERVRVIACLTGRPFMLHSDIEGYGLRSGEWQQVRKSLRASKTDTIVLLWGDARDVDTGVREVFLRAQDALVGVPSETRQAMPDGTTGFERILPGADRMYPDTDTPPMPIPAAWIESIRTARQPRPWEREDAYVALGLDRAAAQRLTASPWASLFDALDVPRGGTAVHVERAMQHRFPRRVREDGPEVLPDAERLRDWVAAIEAGTLNRSTIEVALERLIDTSRPAQAVLASLRPHPDDARALDRLVKDVVRQAPSLRRREPEPVLRWAMGRIMPSMLGHVDPGEVRARLESELLGVIADTRD